MTKPDRFEDIGARRIVGSNATYTIQSRGDIPGQWADWDYDKVTGVTGNEVYGVSHSFARGLQFDFLCGLPVAADAPVPEGQSEVVIPAGTYAVYVYKGHVSGLASIFDQVLCGRGGPGDRWTIATSPHFELYGEDFDGLSASGRVELWFPVMRTH